MCNRKAKYAETHAKERNRPKGSREARSRARVHKAGQGRRLRYETEGAADNNLERKQRRLCRCEQKERQINTLKRKKRRFWRHEERRWRKALACTSRKRQRGGHKTRRRCTVGASPKNVSSILRNSETGCREAKKYTMRSRSNDRPPSGREGDRASGGRSLRCPSVTIFHTKNIWPVCFARSFFNAFSNRKMFLLCCAGSFRHGKP